jgi:hypothetical protein
MSQLTGAYSLKTFLLLFLLLSSLLVTAPVRSEIIHPYDWVKVGAYAKYIYTSMLTVKFPNDTKLWFDVLHSAVLEWVIIEKQGDTVGLNVTLFINGTAYILPPGVNVSEAEHRDVIYLKTLSFDVNVSTREASLDGQPVGKTFFWAEPYATAGEEFIVSSPPSDSIVGNVTYVHTWNNPVAGNIEVYGVNALQLDPFAAASYVFSWYTGVAIELTLLAPWVVPANSVGKFGVTLQNGTAFNITRYAGEPVGANLGLDGASGSRMVEFELNETNIDLSAQTSPEPAATGPGIWEYLPYAFVATFVSLAVVFMVVRRRKKQIRTASTASFSNV